MHPVKEKEIYGKFPYGLVNIQIHGKLRRVIMD
jgi:hypothetical protein